MVTYDGDDRRITSRLRAGGLLSEDSEQIINGVGLSTVHRLFGIGLKLRALSVRQRDPLLAAVLERCVGELDVAIEDVRSVVMSVACHEERCHA